ncbi:MAG: amidohydrolase family protein [Deltaproteobacteria bacterium]|nr:amidohydrolase family protein [Deltaproteobacteria bacterium]
MLIRGAEVAGRIVDVRCRAGGIAEIADALAPEPGEPWLEAAGGALIPGLHDHHLHLFSLAAALRSIDCGPPRVPNAEALARALQAAPSADGWRRGTGYFESVAGPLDRDRLDRLAPGGPLRIQHRSGVAWFLNSAAIAALGLDAPVSSNASFAGIERDGAGRATGRLFRADAWLRERLPLPPPPDLREAGLRLARVGVTGVTDATATNDLAQAALFREAQRSGALPQRVRLMGDASLAALAGDERLTLDARKLLLDEPALPDLDALVAEIAAAHRAGRGCAFHCVTRVELHFALAALEAAGACPGDRLEHASVAPPEAIEQVERLGVRVVTQPNFAYERGDDYLEDVDPRDRAHLYRVKSWLDAGVTLLAGTDAPYGAPDPWLAMHAAVTRRTRSGRALSAGEAVGPATALALFESGSRIAVGEPADLCLLDRPWRAAREALDAERVAATLCAGRPVYVRAGPADGGLEA